MRKSEIIAALERIPGDPEIEVTLHEKEGCINYHGFEIDRINEYPRPEIVVIEK